MSPTPHDTLADPQQIITDLRRERDEALAREAATAEVLQVINSSPGDLAPVFDAMLEKATRLCDARYGHIATYDGEFFQFVAVHGEAGFVEEQLARGLMPPTSGLAWPSFVDGEDIVHFPDVRDTELYRAGDERARRFVDRGRGRSLLAVALRKEEALLGALTLYRSAGAMRVDWGAVGSIKARHRSLLAMVGVALRRSLEPDAGDRASKPAH